MNPYAQNIEFNMTITQEPMTPVFSAITDNPDIEFVEGGVTRTSIGKFNMKITVDGTLYWLFGDITEYDDYRLFEDWRKRRHSRLLERLKGVM